MQVRGKTLSVSERRRLFLGGVKMGEEMKRRL
jgi:hypothetical protein